MIVIKITSSWDEEGHNKGMKGPQDIERKKKVLSSVDECDIFHLVGGIVSS